MSAILNAIEVVLGSVSPVAKIFISMALLTFASMASANPLPSEYQAIKGHLDELRDGSISAALSYVREDVEIYSASADGTQRQLGVGRHSVLPLYVISFGIQPKSVSSYDCDPKANSVLCTFTMRATGKPSQFGLEFWTDGHEISKIVKWYHREERND